MLDIFVRDASDKFSGKRLESDFHRIHHSFLAFHLFDFFVDAFFHKNAFQSSKMKFFRKFLPFKFQFRLQYSGKLLCVIFNHLSASHLNGHIVFYYKKITVDCFFAIGECV